MCATLRRAYDIRYLPGADTPSADHSLSGTRFRAPLPAISLDGKEEKEGETMRKLIALLVVVMSLGIASAKDGGDGRDLFEFDRLAAVVPPFTGPVNPIRGIGGAGAPWQIAEGRAELKSDGRIETRTRGLVLVANGTNPIPNFAVILSCQSIDATGAPIVTNIVAGTTPATATGDSDFEGTVQAPSPCFAPIVFVAIPAGAAPARWLAISGF